MYSLLLHRIPLQLKSPSWYFEVLLRYSNCSTSKSYLLRCIIFNTRYAVCTSTYTVFFCSAARRHKWCPPGWSREGRSKPQLPRSCAIIRGARQHLGESCFQPTHVCTHKKGEVGVGCVRNTRMHRKCIQRFLLLPSAMGYPFCWVC